MNFFERQVTEDFSRRVSFKNCFYACLNGGLINRNHIFSFSFIGGIQLQFIFLDSFILLDKDAEWAYFLQTSQKGIYLSVCQIIGVRQTAVNHINIGKLSVS